MEVNEISPASVFLLHAALRRRSPVGPLSRETTSATNRARPSTFDGTGSTLKDTLNFFNPVFEIGNTRWPINSESLGSSSSSLITGRSGKSTSPMNTASGLTPPSSNSHLLNANGQLARSRTISRVHSFGLATPVRAKNSPSCLQNTGSSKPSSKARTRSVLVDQVMHSTHSRLRANRAGARSGSCSHSKSGTSASSNSAAPIASRSKSLIWQVIR